MILLYKQWRYVLLVPCLLYSLNSLASQSSRVSTSLADPVIDNCEAYYPSSQDTGHTDVNESQAASIARLKRGADDNNAECQYQLGKMHLTQALELTDEESALKKQKLATAKHYLQSAVRQNHHYAQYTLGMLLITADNDVNHSEQSYQAQSYQLMNQAALAGVLEAQGFLARMYLFGIGTDQDNSKAVEWFHRAIDSGNTTSMIDLGQCYMNGNCGLKQDYQQARYWFQRASKAGNPSADLNLFYLNQQADDEESTVITPSIH